jgi:hypothetical protein
MSENGNDGVRSFAKGGIAAALTINSGALIAVLSQIEHLASGSAGFTANAFSAWTIGVAAAALSWVFATLAASFHANGHRKLENVTGWIGYALVISSIFLFLSGGLEIESAIRMINR